MAWSGSWVDNAASRALHNAAHAAGETALSAARAKQTDSSSVFCQHACGTDPEILIELGRFRAFRFNPQGGPKNGNTTPDQEGSTPHWNATFSKKKWRNQFK